ncbi:MAG: hypothetical protein QOI35_1986, partial [Cryptosporangiaceae bacterium]|nr:hypothetical protein [Cryptosporangiaceae bacterium]
MTGPEAASPVALAPPTELPSGLRRYGAVWRLPGAPTLVVAGVLGRLSTGMAPLALVLLLAQVTGSYALAGLASALFGLANAVGGPALGRLADRHGPTPVLLASGVVYPLATGAVLAAAYLRAPAGAVLATCALLGLVMPPLTATLRSVWTDITTGARSALRSPALSLETTVFEVVFVVGPMLVGILAALLSPSAALAAAGLLTAGGTLTVALGEATRASRPHPDRVRARGLGPLLAPGMPMLMAVTGSVTFAFGVVGVTVPAFAAEHLGHASSAPAGVLLGLWGVGSVTGGLWFGTRHFRASLPAQWAVTLSLVALGMASLAIAWSVPVLAVAMLLSGCTLAPSLTVENALVSRIAPAGQVNEAYTWLVTVAVALAALGSSVAGLIVDEPGGVRWAFGLAATTTAMAAGIAAIPRSPLR